MPASKDETGSPVIGGGKKLDAKSAYTEKLDEMIPDWKTANQISEWQPPGPECLTMKEFSKVLGKGISATRLIALRLSSGYLPRDLKWLFEPDKSWITIMRCKTKTNLVEFRAMIDTMTAEGQEEARRVVGNRRQRGRQKIKNRKRHNISLNEDTRKSLDTWAKHYRLTMGEVVDMLVAIKPRIQRTGGKIKVEVEKSQILVDRKSRRIEKVSPGNVPGFSQEENEMPERV